MRAIAALLLALLSLSLVSPAFAADGRGWQGWAFEMREESVRGWVGAWTPGGCEALRRDALEELLGVPIGVCHPVTLVEEPIGVPVWVLLVSDSHFVAASTSVICDEEAAPSDSSIRPVALTSPMCQRLWIRAGV